MLSFFYANRNFFILLLALLLLGFNPIANAQELSSRHALVIGVGKYIVPNIDNLAGVKHDMQSARKIAQYLGVPNGNYTELRDEYATNQGIRNAVGALTKRIAAGDRVFVYFSGHGTRWHDQAISKDECVEALLPSDGVALTNREMAALLEPIAQLADKLIVLLDACHAGGVVQSNFRPRAAGVDDSGLRPRFSSVNLSEACRKPANLRSRSLGMELQAKGILEQNIVHMSTARPNEISLDDANAGGIGTQAFRDCLLGDAVDSDRSGSISIDEIVGCAQNKVNLRLKGNSLYDPHNFTVAGNARLLPAVFKQSAFKVESNSAVVTAISTNPPVTSVNASLAFSDLVAQSDPRRQVSVVVDKPTMRIGKDQLALSVTTSETGFLYLLLLGSDQKSVYLLYPNELDRDNKIEANIPLNLPKKTWAVTAAGPVGSNRLIAMVSQTPRDLSRLSKSVASPFLSSLMNASGAATLQWMAATSLNYDSQACREAPTNRNLVVARACAESFGAVQTIIQEISD